MSAILQRVSNEASTAGSSLGGDLTVPQLCIFKRRYPWPLNVCAQMGRRGGQVCVACANLFVFFFVRCDTYPKRPPGQYSFHDQRTILGHILVHSVLLSAGTQPGQRSRELYSSHGGLTQVKKHCSFFFFCKASYWIYKSWQKPTPQPTRCLWFNTLTASAARNTMLQGWRVTTLHEFSA